MTDSTIKDRLTDPALGACCGESMPGIEGQPLVLACQLCPRSPTYWQRERTAS